MSWVPDPRCIFLWGVALLFALPSCTALGPMPAQAAAQESVQPVPGSACCDSASTLPNSVSVCNAPQQVVAKKPALLPDTPLPVATVRQAPAEWHTVAASANPRRTLLAGPPLYLRLHRLLN